MKVLQKISNLFLALTVMFAATACSNDDDDSTQDFSSLSGNYKGWTSGAFKYSPTPMATPDETVALSVSTDGKATVTYNSNTWGKTTVSDASVVLEGDSYILSGSGKSIMGMAGSAEKEYDCTFTGTVSKDKKTASFVFTLPSVMGGTTITFALGDAPAEKVVAGDYNGYTSAKFSYSPAPIVTDGEKVSITANEDGTLKVVLTSQQWGSGTLAQVSITADGDNYTLEGKEGTLLVPSMSGNGSVSEQALLLSGTISKDKKTVDLTFTAPALMKGTTISFALGSVPSTSAKSLKASYYLKKFVFNN